MTDLAIPLERPLDRPYRILALLQALDVATTYFLLTQWSLRAEGNPIAAHLFGSLGIGVGCLVLLWVKMAVVVSLWRKQTGVRFVSVIYGAVIVNNLILFGMWFTT